MALWLGWLAFIAIGFSAALPISARLVLKKRASPDSSPIRFHVALGTATAVLAFVHTLSVLPELGSPEAIGGGFLSMMSGAVAFCILVAHAGVGLQLRNLRLRDRVRKRRLHVATALAITTAVVAHVWIMRAAS
jgi:hypothetical protein